ncbi:MAG: DUF99 family protein [Nitrososphaerales archaeon]
MSTRTRHLHIEKRAIRALGIAESFKKSGEESVLAGVVMRSDLVIDGVAYGRATVRGDDATDAIIKLYASLDRTDINLVMIGGLIISMYNIIDIERLYERLKIPIIGITFEESEGLDEHIKRQFPDNWEAKIEAYHKLGSREELKLKTGSSVFVRAVELRSKDAKQAINKFLLQGSIPEPIRVARLLARAKLEA